MKSKTPLELNFYHGSPCRIEKFSFEFTGRAINYHGSGFYFTTSVKDARVYCEPREGSQKITFTNLNPTIHKVKLSIANPLSDKHIQPLTLEQVKAIARRSPKLEEALEDFDDVGRFGLEKVLNTAAKGFVGHDDMTLLMNLNSLSNDLFGPYIEAFNHAVKDVLGYDGLLAKVKNSWVAVAWFPEQIEILSRTPFKDPHVASDMEPS
ncbi:hypothetical protein [Pseudomonas putida]|uniref:ART-PolyVal-like domain-containing protein n=1 Tax=Pseudomonas putida TaxID=303 RepID=A0A8I1EBW1_PSEPU|nr:hypothetical protein [Pseudomonas putida]MBI6882439.1 hypothetical protein [Pseudomonas putida]